MSREVPETRLERLTRRLRRILEYTTGIPLILGAFAYYGKLCDGAELDDFSGTACMSILLYLHAFERYFLWSADDLRYFLLFSGLASMAAYGVLGKMYRHSRNETLSRYHDAQDGYGTYQ